MFLLRNTDFLLRFVLLPEDDKEDEEGDDEVEEEPDLNHLDVGGGGQGLGYSGIQGI